MPQPTTTSLVSSANPSVFGEPVTFTATVRLDAQPVPTGSVRFVVDGLPQAPVPLDINGRATLTTNSLGAGTRLITARFLGSGHLLQSEATLTQAVLPGLSIDDVTVQEPNSGTKSAVFTVSLSAPSSDTVSVQFQTASGTATSGSDFLPASGIATFAPGATTRSISVTVLADNTLELVQNFSVALSAPTNATIVDAVGIGRILDKTAPSITSFTPPAGAAGTVVNIFGTNFKNVLAVRFNNAFATFNVVSPTHLQASVPVGATDGSIVVTTLIGSATSPTPFVVRPLIVAFAPASGKVGSSVLILGTGTSNASLVRFGSVPSPFTTFPILGFDLILTTVPPGAATGPIRVTTPAGSAVSASNFVVLP